MLILELALPLVLIAWLYIAPPRSTATFGLHVVVTAVLLVALALLGVWTLWPWWTPYLLGALLAVSLARLKKHRFECLLPAAAAAWLRTLVLAALGVIATQQVAAALAGRKPLDAAVVDLEFPLGPGRYLVVNGGSNTSINAHLRTLDISVPRFKAWRGQSYGVDIVRINAAGLRAGGLLPADPAEYYSYDVPVLAPCSGEVHAAVDGFQDMQVPEADSEHLAGNHVMLRCGAVDVVLAHFRMNSVSVTAGANVRIGEILGRVGNSGNSDEPHLHVHAQTPGTADEPLSGDPVQVRFNGRFPVRNQRVVRD